jgi:hypothetical protein
MILFNNINKVHIFNFIYIILIVFKQKQIANVTSMNEVY